MEVGIGGRERGRRRRGEGWRLGGGLLGFGIGDYLMGAAKGIGDDGGMYLTGE